MMPLQLSPVSTEHALDVGLCDSLPHPASAMWNQLTSAGSFMFSSPSSALTEAPGDFTTQPSMKRESNDN